MAHKCPRCGEDVSRAYGGSAQMAAGPVGALFCAAFGAFQCKKCSKIPTGTVYVDLFFDGFEPDTKELHLLASQPSAAPGDAWQDRGRLRGSCAALDA